MLKYQKSKTKALSVGDKDIISKEILKNIAKDISRHILNIEIREDMELIDKEFTRIEKRDADLIFKNGNEIIHIEIQNNNHKQMHQRMLRYLSDILFEYENLEIKQYLLYIGEWQCNMQNSINKHGLDYSYAIIDMKNISCEELLQSDNPSAVVLSILCDFEEKDKQMVVNTILRRLKELSNEQEFRNYLKMVSVLSTNRNLKDEVIKGVDMLTVDIEKTPFYELGAKNATFDSAMVMIKEFKLAIDDVVEKLNIKKEELLEYMKNKREEA